MRTLKDYILLYLKGLAMGGADAIPGVSGGTIAFISGIYEELIQTIRSFDLKAIKLFFKFKMKELWQYLNANFLLVLFLGIATALVTLANIVPTLLERYPVLLWSFFFGLIVASIIVVIRKITDWNFAVALSLLTGTGFGLWVSIAVPSETSESLWFVFLSGSLAICAMILPGISGSFILVLLGKYKFVFAALEGLKVTILATFVSGCLVGILVFSHFINFLLKKFHDITIALLTGIMIGSLYKVYPWKNTLEVYTDRHGEEKPLIQENVFPSAYEGEPYVLYAVLLAVFGFALVYILERLGGKRQEAKKLD